MTRGGAEIDGVVSALAGALRSRGERLTTAESCTGGLIAAACTDLAGSSDWFERGFVTYSNVAKTDMLRVPSALLEAHGAVSEPVARAMAQGALKESPAQWSVAVTGIAGPGGGSEHKPVGLVWFAWARRLSGPIVSVQASLAAVEVWSGSCEFPGGRREVRDAATAHALFVLLQQVQHTR